MIPVAEWEKYTVYNPGHIEELLNRLDWSQPVTFDLETCGLNPFVGKPIVALGIGQRREGAAPISIAILLDGHEKGQVAERELVSDVLRRLGPAVGQNLKFDLVWSTVRTGQATKAHHVWDTGGASYLMDENSSSSLKVRAPQYLGVKRWNENIDYDHMESEDPRKLLQYLHLDIIYTTELYHWQQENLTPDLRNLLVHVMCPALDTYVEAERHGVPLCETQLRKARKALTTQQGEAYEVLLDDAAWLRMRTDKANFEPVSNWFKDFMRRVWPHEPLEWNTDEEGNPTTPSWNKYVLDEMHRLGNQTAGHILEWRQATKGLQFLDSWESLAVDGAVHPTFNLYLRDIPGSDAEYGTTTGRTSCSVPNLQQVPRAEILRTCFGRETGLAVIEADYSQVELRGAAIVFNETTMQELYRRGIDLHAATAAACAGVSLADVTKAQRQGAKPVNFGFLYGMRAKKFAQYAWRTYKTVVTEREAELFRDRYFAQYPELEQGHERLRALCWDQGFVENPFGRRRNLPHIWTPDERHRAERQAINSPVQSFASDMLLSVLPRVQDAVRAYGGCVVGTIHDSILVVCPYQVRQKVAQIVGEIMSTPQAGAWFDVDLKGMPMVADVSWGRAWYDHEGELSVGAPTA